MSMQAAALQGIGLGDREARSCICAHDETRRAGKECPSSLLAVAAGLEFAELTGFPPEQLLADPDVPPPPPFPIPPRSCSTS